MNPMTNIKNIQKLSAQELTTNNKTSWHDQYRNSAWIFIGGLPYDLTEGDIISVFSQYGEIVNINLVRDKATGKQKGFCFICYEDQRSTVLAVDNFNGFKILGRTIRVDHVNDYKPPKDGDKLDEETKRIHRDGCAPVVETIRVKQEKEFSLDPSISQGIKLPPRLPIQHVKKENDVKVCKSSKKDKKNKKSKKKKTRKRSRKESSSSSSDSSSSSSSSSSDCRSKKRK